MSNIVSDLLIILALVMANGFFVAAEFAIATVSAPRMAQLAEEGSLQAAHIQKILREPQRMSSYLSTVQAGVTLASLGLGMYGEHAIADWLLEPLAHIGWLGESLAHSVATILAVSLLTYLHVVLGEVVPKTLALQSAERAALQLSGTMALIERLLKPLTLILTGLGNAVLRLLGIPLNTLNTNLITSHELEYIVGESTEKGLLKPEEQIYVENVIDFSERVVAQIMTPRPRVVAMPLEATFTEVLEVIHEHRFSRYPVYQEERDHLVGVLHIKDLARYMADNGSNKEENAFALRPLLRELLTVPETLSLEKTLERLRQKQVQIALVINEFGSVAGLVTLEDLAEELIGEIHDEFDAEEVAPITQLSAQHLRVRGDLLLDELNQLYGLHLISDEADTIGGLTMARLGRAAQPGDTIREENVEIQVESVNQRAIGTILLTLPTAPSLHLYTEILSKNNIN